VTTPYGPVNGIDAHQLVFVKACRPIPVFFGHIWGLRSRTGCRSSVARKANAYSIPAPAMVVLQQTNPCTGIDLSGSVGASITATGSVVVDCPSSPPVNFSGANAKINAPGFYGVGTCAPPSDCTNGAATPVSQLGGAVADPLANLPAPLPGDPGVLYRSANAFGNLPCLKGIYYVYGNSTDTVPLIPTCAGYTSMEYLADGIGIDDHVTGAIVLTPPASGTYAGISIFMARDHYATINTRMNSGGSLTCGTIYAPTGSINTPSGNVDITINGQLIVLTIKINGGGGPNGSMRVNPPAGTSSLTSKDIGLEQ
jgi:hypothetical protein